MKDKIERQRAIMRIVSKKKVGSQEELLAFLRQEGIEATQATLSRDLKVMKVVKMHNAEGGYFYSVPTDLRHVVPETDTKHTLAGILSINFSGQFAVVKTRPGYANMLGAIIDGNTPTGVMGTIAGDDTLLVVLRVGTDFAAVIADMEVFLPGVSEKIISPAPSGE